MKRAVSISLGSSKRGKSVKVNLNGQEILVERIGMDGAKCGWVLRKIMESIKNRAMIARF